ncbi:N-alpha-acetyltransferase 35 NatC auxiliary subunit [Homalodisca vitripennis]|nr:N-alpha-acetyltransferase 35 NatC auxiliary subunit [Homalodisca vitripennis]
MKRNYLQIEDGGSVVQCLSQINELLRVTKTNFVVLKLLATGHKRESSNPPEFDFSYHHHFPIIKIH